jgi:hypothetical protein
MWLAAVGVPGPMAGDMDRQMRSVFFSVSLVAIILAVTPWNYVWKRYVSAPERPGAELGPGTRVALTASSRFSFGPRRSSE